MKKVMKLGLAITLSMSIINFSIPVVASAEVQVKGSIVLADKNLNSGSLYSNDGYLVGSGFFIKGGYVVTNSHVYTSNLFSNGYILDGKRKYHKIELVTYDIEKDLALYKSTAIDHPYFHIADKIDTKVQVSAVVNSYKQTNEELHGKFIETNLLSNSETYNKDKPYSTRNRYLFDFNSIKGNSGSPVFNDKNEVIAVIMGEMGLNANGYKKGLAVAVTLDDLKSFLKEQDI